MWRWFGRKQVAASVPLKGDALAEVERAVRALPSAESWSSAAAPAALRGSEAASRRGSELRRLAALAALGETAYQYVVDTAARICDTPMAAIILLDGDTLWFKACAGFAATQAPAEGSPCQLVVARSPELTVLDEPSADPRFEGYALLARQPPLRYYAGAPLITSQGVAVGTVCVVDVVPRELSPVQLRTLQLLARQTALLLEIGARSH